MIGLTVIIQEPTDDCVMMKNGTESPHIPLNSESKKKVAFQWPRKLKKKIKTYFSTEIGLSIFIAIVSMLMVTGILSGRYLAASAVSKSDISLRNVYTEKTLHVQDKVETKHLRYEAREQVSPIYKKRPMADKIIMDRLVDFLENIQYLRQNRALSPDGKVLGLQQLVGQNEPLTPQVTQTLLKSAHWKRIYDVSLKTAEALIQRGVTSEDFMMRKESTVRQAIPPYSGLTPAENDAVVFLVSAKLRPTLTIDEASTEQAKDFAASSVKPVEDVYNKGDLIVRQGEKINDLQRAALEAQGSILNKNKWLSVFAVCILSIGLLSVVWGYLYRFEHSNFFKPTYAGLLATSMVLSVASMALLVDFKPGYAEFYPFAILSLIVCIFTHPRIAILTTIMILLLCGLVLKIPLESLSVLLISSLIGIFVLSRKLIPKDRNDLLLAGLSVGISQGITILVLSFIYEPVAEMDQTGLLFQMMLGFVSGLVTGIFTLGVLPYAESLFKLVTTYTLLEFGNHDRPILRRMQMEAPGTFHHSLMVATLSEAAAEAIGANPVLTRVGALYHDIGKVKRPLFFVENQAYFGVENPHDKLTPRLSKMVITAHPRDGIEMGKQMGLPKVLMRFMPEHHGTLIAGYFYNKAVLLEGEENVNKAQFRYPGPKPQSRETAVVMLADACESSVRALKNPTVNQVEERVDKIFKQRIDDGQFSECPITFQDMQIIRDTFIRILRGIQHNRIEYQQNVLEELGKKPVVESAKQAARSLSEVQLNQSPIAAGSASHRISKSTEDPLIELDSLAELQKQEEGPEPGCC